MGLLRILGLGKDPHIEWMIEAFGAKPGELVVNRLYQDHPKLYRWEGEAGGVPLTFYADSNNKYRGGGTVYLGKAGPQFTGELGEYRCAFYLPPKRPAVSLDDARWMKAAKEAQGVSNWSELLPEEVFEQGLGLGRFAAELDCPLDPRPVFPLLPAIRTPLEAMSEAVDGLCLHPEGVSIGFRVPALTREALVSDVHKGLEILRLSASMG